MSKPLKIAVIGTGSTGNRSKIIATAIAKFMALGHTVITLPAIPKFNLSQVKEYDVLMLEDEVIAKVKSSELIKDFKLEDSIKPSNLKTI